ncbi:MAG TPA: malic enzyme-like NAD(P)-binding protein, partial [Gemmatimonadales bacterium]|nr:malic enzyme-like NAD(P)-binding protein [Gemmatimonadales bacterium]
LPADMIAWTAGRALVAAGSPFEPVSHAGRTLRIGQCNNAFIFPGIGLGALVAGTSEVSDGMFRAAAECLAAEVSADDLAAGALYPRVRDLRFVATRIADAVVRTARDAGLGPWLADEDVAQAVAAAQWGPRYPSFEPE